MTEPLMRTGAGGSPLTRVVRGLYELNCMLCGRWDETKAADDSHAMKRLTADGWTFQAGPGDYGVCWECSKMETAGDLEDRPAASFCHSPQGH